MNRAMLRDMKRAASRAKPAGRVCKPVAVNTMDMAKWRAALVGEAGVQEIMSSLTAAYETMREGLASHNDWALLASAMNTAQAIEKLGVVRGVRHDLQLGELALQAVEQRAMSSGGWRAPVLYAQELGDIRFSLQLHEFQIKRLSNGEMMQAIAAAQAEVIGSGGRILKGVDL